MTKYKPADLVSPRAAMRARKPHLFSDSTPLESPGPENGILLAFALDNIASNSQEHDFELFCTKLAELAIAPNIRPQTGPTGGGDSKSDSTTYPVDAGHALRWYSSVLRHAPDARWGFAYSCKKDWATKVRADVVGIMSVDPKPRHIYFITSQPTRDKRRQEVEAKLAEDHGVDVTVLDRNWIVDKVTTHEWWHLASYLKCPLENRRTTVVGPEDARRTAELQALEQTLKKAQVLENSLYELSCDYMFAALLARGLERSREMVDGYFARAAQLALQSQSELQKLWVEYNRAWTDFWWHEDFVSFLARAEFVIESLGVMRDIASVERAGNLLNLIRGLSFQPEHQRRCEEIIGKHEPLYMALLTELTADTSRPTTAATASLLLASCNLRHGFITADEKAQDDALSELALAFEHARSLGSVQLGHYVDILLMFGEIGSTTAKYDEILNEIVTKHADRVAGASRASALLRRASQSINKHEPMRALNFASLARFLVTAEDRNLQNWCSLMCALAYQAVDCVWAARAEYLYLLHSITNSRPAGEKIPHLSIRPAIELCLCELRLGRPTCFFAAFELLTLLAGAVSPTEEEIQEILQLDIFLGISLLNISLPQISQFSCLDATLERLDLTFTRSCLRFAAGDEAAAGKLFGVPDADISAFFRSAASQPAAEQLPRVWNLNDGTELVMAALVRGATIEMRPEGTQECIVFGESLLTALESLLCGTSFKEVIFHSATIPVSVVSGNSASPSVTQNSAGLAVALPTSARDWMHNDAGRPLASFLLEVIALILGHFSLMQDAVATLEALGDAGAFARSAVGGTIPIILGNLGLDRYHMLSDWPKSEIMLVTRRPEVFQAAAYPGTKQTGELVLDLIDVAAWDSAKWRATAYAAIPRGLEIVLIFENKLATERLFARMSEWCGRRSESSVLSVVIVFDDLKRCYVIQIGPDLHSLVPVVGDHRKGSIGPFVIAGMRRQVFPLSDISRETLVALASGRLNAVALGAAVFEREPVDVGRPIRIGSCRVVESRSIPPDDRELESLVRDLAKADD
jgi:hypothetical protein